MTLLFSLNNLNQTCPLSLSWDASAIDSRRSTFHVGIIASLLHGIFWLQVAFCSSLRQKSLQWIYAYLIVDLCLLFRFFFIYIVRATSFGCEPRRSWVLFLCYFEAIVDNYLNILDVYILLALNICRYIQIVYKRNVYQTDVRLLIIAHLTIYLLPLFSVFVQIPTGWAEIRYYDHEICLIDFQNIYAQTFNILTGYVLPILLNIITIFFSVRHVYLTSPLRTMHHRLSAREKYNRSLVIQFLCFYTIWLALWSPNLIASQITHSRNHLKVLTKLLNFIEITLDPIIIAALDVRLWQVWRNLGLRMKNLLSKPNRIAPIQLVSTL